MKNLRLLFLGLMIPFNFNPSFEIKSEEINNECGSLQDIHKDSRLSSVTNSSLSTTEFIDYFGATMIPLGKALYDSQSES